MYALVPAAGSGSRLGSELPKQYLELAGQPMLAHTVRALLGCARLRGVTVVVAPGDTRAAACLAPQPRLQLADCGGATRAASVRGGLRWLLEHGADARDWVLVHDAARCCITAQAVDRLVDACRDDAVGGLLALPLADTLKRQQDGAAPVRVQATVPRGGLWQAQTPQMFRIGQLADALDAGSGADITDEASAIEAQGLRPLLVPGQASNFKVTLPGDLELAEAVLLARSGTQAPRRLRHG
ncbi:MAG: 2-C-methyl-D-erythritol 4-phosphate cytidylyltransferase [Betaproteobacteria bacterium]|nr:2-C-methyl-D-erythritol 4-phosphate cytidylyltransferase [Betaproteobacteria bacterium]MBU6511270.1 2-C-methyl-D-erythritol 4-phosphate cytidylyltransferase [Betaproteobacteria bacterium]MDE1954312.1 2-C-methyl-D-erythritol 4-phosphate cytidylyltransferase [Betaproteobacteria bacterium]MDE2152831.1 2-C-methyl-D-erythritol 4-phosphate cytidylyltransferase [Betaproteobacteria bacterium]MDE2477310.1 2-C-methyl-D-erythritol 4-phosphate cytidylyltransferase [Betaproteobacteria bacterium]